MAVIQTIPEGLNAGFENADTSCFHCGLPASGSRHQSGAKAFCCQGCLAVYELLSENGLEDFYTLGQRPGTPVKRAAAREEFDYLDEPAVRERLADFSDEKITRITFSIPAIHCIACVWLMENLFRFNPGITGSRVNFLRKEAAVDFENSAVKLSAVVSLLASLGYEPELKLSDLEKRRTSPGAKRLWLQLAVAGFAFGNIMLLSISAYLGLDGASRSMFQGMFGYLSFALALPVFLYSAGDYWRSAWISLRRRSLTIDVPIAAGIVALFGQSAWEVFSGRGEGYFDSLAGLLFFLLCGKLFQRKTYERLAFDRDFRSFFPLSINRRKEAGEERVPLSHLAVGDTVCVRHGELVPADGRLASGTALIDYSFVTGEAEPVPKQPGDYIYAGGRQIGGAIEVRTVKPVSQGYLTSLWNQDSFQKEDENSLNTLTNRYSVRFTKAVVAIAVAAWVFWAFANPDKSIKSFVSVLIVACPCALALAAPFALGTAQRVLGRANVFLKNPHMIEVLARVNAIVFDKTGTLTTHGPGSIRFHGAPLSCAELQWLCSMAKNSSHPYAARIAEAASSAGSACAVDSFLETPGCGMEGTVEGNEIWMGSDKWLAFRGVAPNRDIDEGSAVHVAINGKYRGVFSLAGILRPDAESLIESLSPGYDLALLSGDNEKERPRFERIFGPDARLRFNQSPLDKLNAIRELQASGRTVLMVGDGLNDAGALKQSDAGIAVVENASAFSPASDVIMAAGMVPRLDAVLRFSNGAVRIVRASFGISTVYNVLGIAIAASGNLSPIVCAILMPLSSVTVVAFACGTTALLGRRTRFEPAGPTAGGRS